MEFGDKQAGIRRAVERGWYMLTRRDYAAMLRDLVMEQPTEGDPLKLQVGSFYLFTPRYGSKEALYRVDRITATQAVCTCLLNDGSPSEARFRVSKHGPTEPGTFRLLPGELVDLSQVEHADVVGAAVLKTDMPARVKREYPALFVRFPEWLKPKSEHETVASRVEKCLAPQRGTLVPGPAEVLGWIAEAQRQHTQLTCEAIRATARNPANADDYVAYLEGYRRDGEFYRWLLPHVSPGGIFWVAPSEG